MVTGPNERLSSNLSLTQETKAQGTASEPMFPDANASASLTKNAVQSVQHGQPIANVGQAMHQATSNSPENVAMTPEKVQQIIHQVKTGQGHTIATHDFLKMSTHVKEYIQTGQTSLLNKELVGELQHELSNYYEESQMQKPDPNRLKAIRELVGQLDIAKEMDTNASQTRVSAESANKAREILKKVDSYKFQYDPTSNLSEKAQLENHKAEARDFFRKISDSEIQELRHPKLSDADKKFGGLLGIVVNHVMQDTYLANIDARINDPQVEARSRENPIDQARVSLQDLSRELQKTGQTAPKGDQADQPIGSMTDFHSKHGEGIRNMTQENLQLRMEEVKQEEGKARVEAYKEGAPITILQDSSVDSYAKPKPKAPRSVEMSEQGLEDAKSDLNRAEEEVVQKLTDRKVQLTEKYTNSEDLQKRFGNDQSAKDKFKDEFNKALDKEHQALQQELHVSVLLTYQRLDLNFQNQQELGGNRT